jgi:putative transposase
MRSAPTQCQAPGTVRVYAGSVKRMERVRLYPGATQRLALAKMLDVTRQLYNAALEQRIAAYRERRVSVSASMQYRELTSLRAEDVRIASV